MLPRLISLALVWGPRALGVAAGVCLYLGQPELSVALVAIAAALGAHNAQELARATQAALTAALVRRPSDEPKPQLGGDQGPSGP